MEALENNGLISKIDLMDRKETGGDLLEIESERGKVAKVDLA